MVDGGAPTPVEETRKQRYPRSRTTLPTGRERGLASLFPTDYCSALTKEGFKPPYLGPNVIPYSGQERYLPGHDPAAHDKNGGGTNSSSSRGVTYKMIWCHEYAAQGMETGPWRQPPMRETESTCGNSSMNETDLNDECHLGYTAMHHAAANTNHDAIHTLLPTPEPTKYHHAIFCGPAATYCRRCKNAAW